MPHACTWSVFETAANVALLGMVPMFLFISKERFHLCHRISAVAIMVHLQDFYIAKLHLFLGFLSFVLELTKC